jgi:tetratricopeptide (TPR) repeat protein
LIHLDQQWAAAYLTRAHVWQKTGDLDRAIADYSEALRLNPANDTAFVNRGWAYSLMGQTDEAIADYTEALRHNPDNALAYINRGNLYNQPAVRPGFAPLFEFGLVRKLAG